MKLKSELFFISNQRKKDHKNEITQKKYEIKV